MGIGKRGVIDFVGAQDTKEGTVIEDRDAGERGNGFLFGVIG